MSRHPRKPRKAPQPRPARRITRGRRKQIEALADALAYLAPATSPGTGFCVRQVAKEHGVKKLWKGGGNKRQMIARFLEGVFRRYPRKPKTVVMAVVRGGLDWRARKGEPTTRGDLERVATPMKALGLDVQKELEGLEFPEPSRLREPPQDKVALLQRLELHEALTDDCLEMYRNGHFNEAVRKGLERFERQIQDAIGDQKTIGRQLMAKAFNKAQPLIPINANDTGNDLSEQEGFMHLTMGAMAGLRNLYSHGDVEQMSATDAIERLSFVSLLFKRVERAVSTEADS